MDSRATYFAQTFSVKMTLVSKVRLTSLFFTSLIFFSFPSLLKGSRLHALYHSTFRLKKIALLCIKRNSLCVCVCTCSLSSSVRPRKQSWKALHRWKIVRISNLMPALFWSITRRESSLVEKLPPCFGNCFLPAKEWSIPFYLRARAKMVRRKRGRFRSCLAIWQL